MLPQQTSILIVGAGPVGLALALSLSFQGYKDFIIVDAVERAVKPVSSRAIVIHSATLEVSELIMYFDVQ
jgi:2-polyprenyl-6-methoxyphenol hydroxylase-like FAD-dependent oxidoreductase